MLLKYIDYIDLSWQTILIHQTSSWIKTSVHCNCTVLHTYIVTQTAQNFDTEHVQIGNRTSVYMRMCWPRTSLKYANYSLIFSMDTISLIVALRQSVNLSYRIRIKPCLPSCAQCPASQYN